MSVAHCNKRCPLSDVSDLRSCVHVHMSVMCACELHTVCVCVCVYRLNIRSFDDCKLNVGSEWPLMSPVQKLLKYKKDSLLSLSWSIS